MARFKNTVADVEVKIIKRKNTVLVMQEDVQVVLGKPGMAEQARIFDFLSITNYIFII